MSSITDYLLVFAIGGAICVIGQLLMSLTRLTPARILVIFVTAGVVLTAVGLYKPIVELGGAGNSAADGVWVFACKRRN